MWAGLGLDWEQEGHGAGGCLIGETSKGTLKTFPLSFSPFFFHCIVEFFASLKSEEKAKGKQTQPTT